MGYYVCPKCKSKDSFKGTTAVGVTNQGPKIIGEFGDSGVYGSAGRSSTEVKMVTIQKCRDCGEILGEKDYRLTPEEIEHQRALEAKEREAFKLRSEAFWKSAKRFGLGVLKFGLVIGVGYLLGGGIGWLIGQPDIISALIGTGISFIGLSVVFDRRRRAKDRTPDTEHKPASASKQEPAVVVASGEESADSNGKKRDKAETVLPDPSRATHADPSNPKCKNLKRDEEAILFDCPHCGTDTEIDEQTLMRIWDESAEGLITCPMDECAKKYVAPTLQEISKLN
jgi:DNA-directed RNA polymerase subunit M/transcription elongation factor TFIIS